MAQENVKTGSGNDGISRRGLLGGGAALAVAGALAGCGRQDANGDAAPAASGESELDASIVEQCETMLDLSYDDDDRAQIVATMDDQLEAIRAVRDIDFNNQEAPALVFDPRLPGRDYSRQPGGLTGVVEQAGDSPGNAEDVAFAPVSRLAQWIATKQLSARELARVYLDRIERYNPLLHNYITVTEELALSQAARADEETVRGRSRGPLHGIPYGLKDLVDTKGIRTTWGATPYKDRVAESDAWIVTALEEAGAVLLGKTTNGALAYGDLWFDAVTRNPWNPAEGSSGSSAGSASATAAGLCAFSIGTETLGSIVSPSTRCGATGLRPTFGRVPRSGAMALCWSLDKVGPICRSVRDTALVLAAINGHKPDEPGCLDHGFEWDATIGVDGLRVGYDPRWFENADPVDMAALEAMRALPVEMVEISIPDMPVGPLLPQLEAEAAASFQELTLSDRDDLLRWQADRAWPNTFRRIHFYSAVDLIQGDRLRRRVMQMMAEQMAGVDAMIGPNFAGGMLVMTNYTGHPCLTLRAGFGERELQPLTGQAAQQGQSLSSAVGTEEGREGEKAGPETFSMPRNISLWAPLFEERATLSLGLALEASLDVARRRPPLDDWLSRMEAA